MNLRILDCLPKKYLDIKVSELNAVYHHIPVLLKPSVDDLITDPEGVYVDVTFGGGGHSREILSRLGKKAKLYSFDRDFQASGNRIDDARFELILSDFMYLKKYMQYYKIERVNGILADLGLSSHHLDTGIRGFSIHSDQPLDMRMNTEQQVSAQEVIMSYPVRKLEFLFKEYGELTNARRIAEELIKERSSRSFRSCQEFAHWAERFSYGRKIKFLAQVFQSLRIEVNHEIDSLKALLRQGADILKPGGRMVVISYHSLEDRLVKQWFRSGDPEVHDFNQSTTPFTSLHKQAIKPDETEIKNNPRSRSAKMRTGIKS